MPNFPTYCDVKTVAFAAVFLLDRAAGDAMTLDDLGAHRAEWMPILSQSCAGAVMHELPPNGQRILTYGQDPQTAVEAPRWRVLSGRRVAVEPTMKPLLIDELRARGHDIVVERGNALRAVGW